MKKIYSPLILLVFATTFFSLTAKAGDYDGKVRKNNKQFQSFNNRPKEGKRVPIDGGITLLLAAGCGYGIKRISNKNKKKDIQF